MKLLLLSILAVIVTVSMPSSAHAVYNSYVSASQGGSSSYGGGYSSGYNSGYTNMSSVHNSYIVRGGPSYNTGYGNSGFGNTGYGNSGYGNTGYGNSGYGNTGYGNSGFGNTGYGNSGFGNTGYGNSGFGNSSGYGRFYPLSYRW